MGARYRAYIKMQIFLFYHLYNKLYYDFKDKYSQDYLTRKYEVHAKEVEKKNNKKLELLLLTMSRRHY